MPNVDGVIVGLRFGVYSEIIDEEGNLESTEILIDDDTMPGVSADLSSEVFTEYTDTNLSELAVTIGNEVTTQVYESLVEARDAISEAQEIDVVIEMFQDQEPDWEV